MNTKRITILSFFIAMALVFSILESLLPPIFVFAPGAKMGLSNVVTLIAIVILGYVDATIIQVLRCILGGILTGGLTGIMYSLPAGLASLIIMSLLYRFTFPKFSLMGISFFGAVLNNIVQVFIASIIVEEIRLASILPLYLLASITAGLFVGIASYFVIKYLPKKLYINNNLA